MHVHHELLGLVFHVSSDERGQVESGISIKTEVVLDHAVCNRRRHLLVWHLVAGQVLGSIFAPVHTFPQS